MNLNINNMAKLVSVPLHAVEVSPEKLLVLEERGLVEYMTRVSSGDYSGFSVYRYIGTDDNVRDFFYNDILIVSWS